MPSAPLVAILDTTTWRYRKLIIVVVMVVVVAADADVIDLLQWVYVTKKCGALQPRPLWMGIVHDARKKRVITPNYVKVKVR